jgi:hexokinase
MDIKAWLKDNGVAADIYDAGNLLEGFLKEMEKGLNGDELSSLAMIPAYVGIGEEVPAAGKSVAVIDAGGTNLRIGIAHFDENGMIHKHHDFKPQMMPGSVREVSASEFYAVLADALEPHADEFDNIGFCFSYPAEIQPNLDGLLLHWTKEIQIPELVNKLVGQGLLKVLTERGIKGKQIVVLNDTVATLLAGRAVGRTFNASSYIGFILGTGTNTAYVEHNKNIKKLGGDFDKEGSQVINVESGGFAAFDRGQFDLKLDKCCTNRGKHVFEKMISGAYLGLLTLKLLQVLSAKAVFSIGGAKALLNINDLSTKTISHLAAGTGTDDENVRHDPTAMLLRSDVFTDADRDIMKMVFAAVVERAALLTAVNIAAAVVKSGEGKDAERPVCVNIDGSTYYKAHQLEDKVQSYLKEILDVRGLHIRCIEVKDAPIVGAAIAGLTAFYKPATIVTHPEI